MKILVVDDDPRLRELVAISLERAHFDVVTANDGRMALTHVARDKPDLIVLDVGMPEMDGYETCRRIRATSNVPIIFLTAQDDEVDRILGFEMGADDFVAKPFSPRELVARVRAVLKRSAAPQAETMLRLGNLSLDVASHVCKVRELEIALTSTEFALLAALVRHPAQIRTRGQLIGDIWGAASQVSDRTLDSHLRNLRSKLATAGLGEAIETVHGVGIRMREEML